MIVGAGVVAVIIASAVALMTSFAPESVPTSTNVYVDPHQSS